MINKDYDRKSHKLWGYILKMKPFIFKKNLSMRIIIITECKNLKSKIKNFDIYPIQSINMYFIDSLFIVLINPGE